MRSTVKADGKSKYKSCPFDEVPALALDSSSVQSSLYAPKGASAAAPSGAKAGAATAAAATATAAASDAVASATAAAEELASELNSLASACESDPTAENCEVGSNLNFRMPKFLGYFQNSLLGLPSPSPSPPPSPSPSPSRSLPPSPSRSCLPSPSRSPLKGAGPGRKRARYVEPLPGQTTGNGGRLPWGVSGSGRGMCCECGVKGGLRWRLAEGGACGQEASRLTHAVCASAPVGLVCVWGKVV